MTIKSNIKGVISSKARHGKSIKLDGADLWYGVFHSSSLSEYNQGDTVSFDYTVKEKDGRQYHNIDADSLKLIEQGAGAASAPTSVASVASNKPGAVKLDRDRTIIRQNALGRAVEFMAPYITKETDPAEVIAVARIFEGYTSGDDEAKRAAELLKEEAA